MFEHITTAEAAEFVERCGAERRARRSRRSICIINRNAMFAGGLRPHAYCLPVAKREKHRLAVRKAATSGSPKFFLGTDSAPHAREAKESACGCAGIFNAPFALESYATVFEEEGALDRFEAFASDQRRRASTACRSTRGRSRWSAPTSRCPDADRRRSCRSTPARRCAGASPAS